MSLYFIFLQQLGMGEEGILGDTYHEKLSIFFQNL